MHTYQLVIAGLSVYGFGGKIKPLIKLGVAYLSKMVLNLGISKFKCLLLSMWSTAGSSISSLAAVIFAKLVALALKQSVLIHMPIPLQGHRGIRSLRHLVPSRLPCRVTSTSSTVMRTTVGLRSLPIASSRHRSV
jgi:hypothetical protein